MIIGLISLLVFLFTVYELSHDDFLYLRKGIVTEDIFNLVFLGLPISLFTARLLYVALHPSLRYLNPFIFFIVPYFPGLSMIGGILGAWGFAWWYAKKKKLPTGHVIDTLFLSFLSAFAVGLLLQAGIEFFTNPLLGSVDLGRSVVSLIVFFALVFRFMQNQWKEGRVTAIALVTYALMAFVSTGFTFLSHRPIVLPVVGATVLFFFLSLFMLLENILLSKKGRK